VLENRTRPARRQERLPLGGFKEGRYLRFRQPARLHQLAPAHKAARRRSQEEGFKVRNAIGTEHPQDPLANHATAAGGISK
jgi:hypothetical protein